jgi:hypothetical protein
MEAPNLIRAHCSLLVFELGGGLSLRKVRVAPRKLKRVMLEHVGVGQARKVVTPRSEISN